MINAHKQIADKVRTLVAKSREGDEFVGFLGNLNGIVEADKFNNVNVLIHGIEFTAYNEKVPKIAFLPVKITKRSGRLQVTEARNVFHRTTYMDIPDHDHTWGRSTNPTWVRGEQFLPGLVIPHDSGLSVHFTGLIYWLDGDFRVCMAQDVDLSGEIPAYGARFVLLEADEDGAISLKLGDVVAGLGMLTYADIPAPSAGKKSLNFAVKLYAGQSRIQQGLEFMNSDVVDLRWAGLATASETAFAVEWDDILDKPLVFPPDLDIAIGRYIFNAPPTVNDDESEGYRKLDPWLDQSTGIWYICIDNAEGAADWQTVGEGGGGSGDLIFQVEGGLSVLNSASQPILITKDITISAVYLYCENTGASGQTRIDITTNGLYEPSIFDDMYPDYPILPYDDADGWVKVVPTVTEFSEGDVLKLNIEEIADGAQNMVVVLQVSGSGGSGFNLVVTDGVNEVSPTGKITIEGAEVSDEGGGEAKITMQSFPNIPTLSVTPSGTLTTTSSSFADVDGSNMQVSINKVRDDTDIFIDFRGSVFSSATNTTVEFAVREGSTDHVVHNRRINPSGQWVEMASMARITGLDAGTRTFRLRWRRAAGTGTVSMTYEGRVYLSAQEVKA
jgi:hypothetical protein